MFEFLYRYEVMRECWQRDPSLRPSFTDLCKKFDVLLDRMTRKASEAIGYIEAIGSLDGSGLPNLGFDSLEEEEEEKDPRYVTKLPAVIKPKPKNDIKVRWC